MGADAAVLLGVKIAVGGQRGLPEAVVGRVSRELDGVQEIWAFFMRNRRAG